jgi:hypothetical protein
VEHQESLVGQELQESLVGLAHLDTLASQA